MPDRLRPIIWIASYPRSGNTYLRALISNFIADEARPVPLNDLRQYVTGENQPEVWREVAGKPAGELELDESWPRRAAYFERLRAWPGVGALLVKTHTIDGAYKDIQAFDFHPGDRVLHLVRHPGDVAVSSADFHGHGLERSVTRLVTPGLIVDGRPQTGIGVIGSWAQHTRMWRNERRVPVLTVRYPDLVEHPAQALSILIPYIGYAPDPQRIARSVEFSSFERLRDQEQAEGFAEASLQSTSGRFFREGRSGQWRDALTAEQAERLISPNQALIEELGLGGDA